MSKPKIIVICGPTASGKTKLGVELAKRINGEIISADSMQIYKYMDIGSAKPTKEEMQGIKHYLVDFVEPNKRYSVADYKKDAVNAIHEVLKKKKNPIVVGGTGLYINSLVYGIEYREIELDEKYREQLEKRAQDEGLEKLYQEACKIDEQAIKNISPNDKKRIIRVLEIYKATGKTKTEMEKLSRQKENEFDYIVFGCNMEREKLYEKINQRVDLMIKKGLIEEVQKIINMYDKFPTAMQALGYKETKKYLDNEITKEEMIDEIKMQTRRYAKRQLTWFRKNKNIIWLDMEKALRRKYRKNIGGSWSFMSEEKPKTSKIRNKIFIVIATIFIAIVPICFIYSMAVLIMEPTKVFVIENRKNI